MNIIGKQVWVTKYALTTGIFSAVISKHGNNDYIFLEDRPHEVYILSKDAFLTEEEAKA